MFLMIITTINLNPPIYSYTLYRYVLAEDIWRVLYLKNGPAMFFYLISPNQQLNMFLDIKNMEYQQVYAYNLILSLYQLRVKIHLL